VHFYIIFPILSFLPSSPFAPFSTPFHDPWRIHTLYGLVDMPLTAPSPCRCSPRAHRA
jgi:hypothetical protein